MVNSFSAKSLSIDYSKSQNKYPNIFLNKLKYASLFNISYYNCLPVNQKSINVRFVERYLFLVFVVWGKNYLYSPPAVKYQKKYLVHFILQISFLSLLKLIRFLIRLVWKKIIIEDFDNMRKIIFRYVLHNSIVLIHLSLISFEYVYLTFNC